MISNKDLMIISEKMGEAVHDAWMKMRKKEKGWHAPEKCPVLAKTKKAKEGLLPGEDGRYCENCHPCMRPYKDLPESEKKLDRQYPELFFKILNDMGYVINEK